MSSCSTNSLIPVQRPLEDAIFSCNKPGQWALTLDDGPNAYVTPRILDLLKKENVKATFFIYGSKLSSEGHLMRRAFDEGHLIASHTVNHLDLSTLSEKEIENEVLGNDDLIRPIIGKTPLFFRPPYGVYSDDILRVLHRLGKEVVIWNLDSNDWRYLKQEPYVLEDYMSVVRTSNPRRDSFISLGHDIHNVTLHVLPEVIKGIKAAGYKFVRLDECKGLNYGYAHN